MENGKMEKVEIEEEKGKIWNLSSLDLALLASNVGGHSFNILIARIQIEKVVFLLRFGVGVIIMSSDFSLSF
jgi:hypothetical protein